MHAVGLPCLTKYCSNTLPYTGENPSDVYSQTRMDSAWYFRQAYDEARKIKEAQDEFCNIAEAGLWDELGLGEDGMGITGGREFPEDLQWEALVDVLRGKVKVCDFP